MNRKELQAEIKALRANPEVAEAFNCDLRQTTEKLQALYEAIIDFNEEIDEAIKAADESWGIDTEDEDFEDYRYPTTEKYRGEYDALIDSYFPEDEEPEAQQETTHYTPVSFPQPYVKPSVWYGITEGADGESRGSHFINPSAKRVPTPASATS